MTFFKDFLASQILVPALEKKRGVGNGKYIRRVARIQTASLVNIKQHQLTRLRAICEKAKELPLYASRFKQAKISDIASMSFDDFSRLEPIGREDVRELGKYLEDAGKISPETVSSATGGTTSSPVKFYMSQDVADHRWSATRFFDAQSGYKPGKKIAYLWGAPQDIPEYKKGLKSYLLQNWIERRKFIAASSLSDAQMYEAWRSLKEFKPCLLQAYPTSLYILAQFMLQENLKLNIPAITCTAEKLADEYKGVIQQAFGSMPIEWYGARDAGRIATECKHHRGMHLNCYGLYVETTQRNKLGRILLSDLWNDFMPLLRYDISDVAELTEELCECGSAAPRLQNLAGRAVDIFVAAGGRLVPGVTLTNRVVKGSEEVKEMQIIQLGIGRFQIKLVSGESYQGESTNKKIKLKLEELLADNLDVEFMEVVEIPVGRSGKKRFCVNEMPEQELRGYI